MKEWMCVCLCESLSHVRVFTTPWTVACQLPLSMRFLRQEYWNELPFPSPGDLPNQGIEPGSPVLQADSLPREPPGTQNSPGKSTRVGSIPFSGVSSQPRDGTQFSCVAGRLFTI